MKVRYECKLCNYSTHLKGNFSRHLNSKRHETLVWKTKINLYIIL